MVDKNIVNYRLEDETFEEYKTRLRNANQAIKWYMKSKFPEQLRWNSDVNGTYKMDEHGPLE